MNKEKSLNQRKVRRAIRTRAKLASNTVLPRLSVFRSLRHIYAQIIDDNSGKVLVQASDILAKDNITKINSAQKVGNEIAEKAIEKKIKAVRFDRGSYKYHGRVATLAESAREKGLSF